MFYKFVFFEFFMIHISAEKCFRTLFLKSLFFFKNIYLIILTSSNPRFCLTYSITNCIWHWYLELSTVHSLFILPLGDPLSEDLIVPIAERPTFVLIRRFGNPPRNIGRRGNRTNNYCLVILLMIPLHLIWIDDYSCILEVILQLTASWLGW